MSRKPRKQYSGPEKVAILRERLLEGRPLSDVCETHQLPPTVFYAWQKQFFENGAAAFERKHRPAKRPRTSGRSPPSRKSWPAKNEVMAELMEEHVELKKSLGNSERTLGPPRHPRPGRRFRQALGGPGRDCPASRFIALAGPRRQQVPRLEGALRQGQRAQRAGSPATTGWRTGRSRPSSTSRQPSPGRLPAADLHDARRRRGGRQPVQRLSRAQRGGTARADTGPNPRRKARASSSRCGPTSTGTSTSRYLNIAGTFLLPVQPCSTAPAGSSSHWEIRETMTEAGVEIILQRAQEKFPDEQPADHLRQRPAVHRQGLQGVHPDLGHDPRANLALLSAEQRQDRALAQDPQERMHPARHAAVLEDARRLVAAFVEHYNKVRLHSAIGLRHAARQTGRTRAEIFAERDRKLEAARQTTTESAQAAGGAVA